MASFLCNGIIFGIINSFGTIFVALEKQLQDEKSNLSGMLASLVGSVAVGFTFLLSPVSSILTDRYGIQKTSFAGSFLATLGMLLSAFCLIYASGYEVSQYLDYSFEQPWWSNYLIWSKYSITKQRI